MEKHNENGVAKGCSKEDEPDLCIMLSDGEKVYFKNVQTIFMLSSKPSDITFCEKME